MNIGPLEIIIIVVVLLLLFGARRLPELGRNLGSGIRGFGKAISGDDEEERRIEAAAPKPPRAPSDLPPEPAGESRPRADDRDPGER